jgi:hypothetical protein
VGFREALISCRVLYVDAYSLPIIASGVLMGFVLLIRAGMFLLGLAALILLAAFLALALTNDRGHRNGPVGGFSGQSMTAAKPATTHSGR